MVVVEVSRIATMGFTEKLVTIIMTTTSTFSITLTMLTHNLKYLYNRLYDEWKTNKSGSSQITSGNGTE